ncbi:glycosyltransferase family 2 protein [uncultured Mucilaginibacter sp.]|uniref:glycosyltransferase family 2 protein n=1 Tax=uncultured Mucilaginibacter sp. TaxID=797541 RepID=UPI0025D600A6|nr:glycosyltransferase family 2 protein [uncultured Mucilaginibacter sp.]
MKVSIITVNFNQPRVTEELLATIPAIEDFEIIVVDNGSEKDVTQQLQINYPTVKFFRSEKNLGFAGGNNLGILQASGEYLFFVNNDTEFTPGLMEILSEVLDKHPEVGMVSPKIKYFYNKGMIQYAGYTPLNYYTGRNSCIGLRENDEGQYDHITAPTAYCHGAAMMVRKKAIEKAGMMNENFFLYYEELDWGEHIKRAGYQAWVCTEALIYHKESVSVGKNSRLKEYFMNRNRILFMRRNAPFFKKIIFYLYFILLVVPRNVISYIKAKNYNYIPTLIKAVWWNLTHNKNSKDLGYR